jgi:hypothetical protein
MKVNHTPIGAVEREKWFGRLAEQIKTRSKPEAQKRAKKSGICRIMSHSENRNFLQRVVRCSTGYRCRNGLDVKSRKEKYAELACESQINFEMRDSEIIDSRLKEQLCSNVYATERRTTNT